MGKRTDAGHALVETPAGVVALRDLYVDEIGEIVRYWHERGCEHLRVMGADPVLLGSSKDTERRFAQAVRTADPEQRNLAFALELKGELIGYTLLNRYSAEINYSHWHILCPELRGQGISTALYPHRLKMYFDLTSMRRLIHQTRASNAAINRMLDKFVPVSERCYVAQPDGVAAPGDFNLRYVRREDVPRLFETAAKLRKS